jgi:hypothetical protein
MHFISTSFINSKKSVVFMLQSQVCKNVKFAQRGKNTLFWFYLLWGIYTTDRIRLVPITVQARISTNHWGLETSTNVHKSLGTGDQHELPLTFPFTFSFDTDKVLFTLYIFTCSLLFCKCQDNIINILSKILKLQMLKWKAWILQVMCVYI